MGKWGSRGITVTFLFIALLQSTTLFGKDCFEFASLNCKQIIALLQGPPPGLSLAEGDLVLAIQQTASDAERKAAEGENHFAFKSFYDAMGFKFDGDDYPQTKSFFKTLSSNLGHSVKKIKKHFDRKRPVHFDNRITNHIVSPTDPSYPSGHATMGLFWATLLADLRPDLKAKLLERGRLIGWHRIILGVHYPSDVTAGFYLGEYLAKQVIQSTLYQEKRTAIIAEWNRIGHQKPEQGIH